MSALEGIKGQEDRRLGGLGVERAHVDDTAAASQSRSAVHALKRPFRDGITEFLFEPLDFLRDWLPSCRTRQATSSA